MTGDSVGLMRVRNAILRNCLMSAIPYDLPLRRVSIPWKNSMRPWKIPTLGDAILDRLVNNAHKIELTGESMRKVQGHQELNNESTS